MQKRRRTKAKSIKPQNTARNEKKTLTRDLPDAVDRRFHSILDTMVEGCQIISHDWRYIYLNEAAIGHGRKTREELLGHTMMEVYPGIENTDMFRKLRLCMSERKPFRIENNFIYPDGSSAWFDLSVQPASDGIFILSIDMTEHKNTEKEIKNLAKITSEDPNPVMRIDPDGRLIYANPASSVLMNLWKCAIGGKLPANWRHTIKEAFAANSRPEIDVESEGRTYSIQIVPVPDSGLLNLYGRDITERKKAEEAMRESERKLRETQKMAHMGSWYWDVKTGDVEWSEEVYRIFRLDPEEFTPHIDSILELSPWPEDHQRDKELINRALETHCPGFYEQKFLRPDKSIGYYSSTFQGSYDEKGDLISIAGAVIDITERKRAEEKIRKLNDELEKIVVERTSKLESANKELIKEITERKRIAETLQMHAAIIENSDDAIYGKDLQGIITSWNKGAERIYGYSDNEAVGQPVSMLLPPDMPDDLRTILSKIANGEHIVHYETKRQRKDSQIIEVSVSISPIRDQSGKITGASTIARDTTERKLAEESINKLNAQLENNVRQLEAANKELEAFSYSVSHDLRAPLRAIDGFSKVLMEKSSGQLDKEAVRHLNIIRSNTQNMGRLIDDLLSFSRIGRQEMRLTLINMERMARETLEELKQQNPGRNIEFISKKTPQTSGDAAMIKIVLVNLLANAVKFTRQKPEAAIEFGGSIEDNEIIYYVKDNGAGFNMQYVNKLFGVFQRLHRQDEFEGTGVGLALVQRIVHRHGGRVWAEGTVDEGAVFYFTLPVKKEEINER